MACLDMDPLHLTNEEVDYELRIRKVFGLRTFREKTKALRELIRKEKTGVEKKPEADHEDDAEETEICCRGMQELDRQIELAISTRQKEEVKRLTSRLISWDDRMNRIGDKASAEFQEGQELLRTIWAQVKQVSWDTVPVTGLPLRPGGVGRGSRITGGATVQDGANSSIRPSLSLQNSEEQANVQTQFGNRTNYTSPGLSSNLGDAISQTNIYDDAVEEALRVANLHNRVKSTTNTNQIRDNALDSIPMENLRLFDTRNRAVPVHKWRISYSGDGKGLSLMDFLSRVEVLAKAEHVSESQLLASVHHLLSERAEAWYFANHQDFITWEECVTAMKNEFLHQNYNFLMHDEISHRRQAKDESFSAYLTAM